MRILALHGHGSDAAGLRRESVGLRRFLRQRATFVFAEGEFVCEDGGRYWFEEEDAGCGTTESPVADTPGDSVSTLLAAAERLGALLDAEGPFDAIFGFSQGAALAAVAAALRQGGRLVCDLRAVVIVAGYLPACAVGIPGLGGAGDVQLPSLHIFGQQDTYVPHTDSEALARCFLGPVFVRHPGGHRVSRGLLVRRACQEFLDGIASCTFLESQVLGPPAPKETPEPEALPLRCISCLQQPADSWAHEETGEMFCDRCWERWEDDDSDEETSRLWTAFCTDWARKTKSVAERPSGVCANIALAFSRPSHSGTSGIVAPSGSPTSGSARSGIVKMPSIRSIAALHALGRLGGIPIVGAAAADQGGSGVKGPKGRGKHCSAGKGKGGVLTRDECTGSLFDESGALNVLRAAEILALFGYFGEPDDPDGSDVGADPFVDSFPEPSCELDAYCAADDDGVAARR